MEEMKELEMEEAEMSLEDNDTYAVSAWDEASNGEKAVAVALLGLAGTGVILGVNALGKKIWKSKPLKKARVSVAKKLLNNLNDEAVVAEMPE